MFLPLGRFFILVRVLVFLANRDKKYIYPKGIFSTGKFTFWRGKNLLRVEKCNSWVNARHFSSFGMTKKSFVLWQGHFGLRPVFGIFLAFRRPSAFFRPKKSQKRASGQNDLAAAQNFFLSFLMMILSCISPWNITFLSYCKKLWKIIINNAQILTCASAQ